MNKDEAKQHVRDSRTAEKAMRDFDDGKYKPPVSAMDEMLNICCAFGTAVSAQDRHDDEVYDAAYAEARRTSK
jgi:hypothetical protein